MQLLNQLAGMPNASGSLLQNSDLTKHSLPMELMYSISTLIYFGISSKGNFMRINCLFFCCFRAQQFSYQNNQLPWALGLYNSETGSTMFREIFIPLRYENVGSSAPNLMQTPLSNHTEQGNSEPRGNARSRLEVGESSPFKRLRRETNEPQAPSAEQIMGNSLSLPTGASASPDIGNLLPPRPIMNSLYDPMFEELGLPIDPHLRLFAKYK
ncbi:hypothetical protein ES319_D05G301200v1, partial [Gossypium barbadense]